MHSDFPRGKILRGPLAAGKLQLPRGPFGSGNTQIKMVPSRPGQRILSCVRDPINHLQRIGSQPQTDFKSEVVGIGGLGGIIGLEPHLHKVRSGRDNRKGGVARETMHRRGPHRSIRGFPETDPVVVKASGDEGKQDGVPSTHFLWTAPIGRFGPDDDIPIRHAPAQKPRAMARRNQRPGGSLFQYEDWLTLEGFDFQNQASFLNQPSGCGLMQWVICFTSV